VSVRPARDGARSGVKKALAALIAWSSIVRAEPPAASVDVADLPPLPAATEEPLSTAVVLAASEASEDVVVGAAKREQSLGNVASAVTVVSGDRIRRFGYRTVGEAIAGVAGLYLEDDRIVQTIGIRGLNVLGDFNTRILVLIDGATVNEAWGSFAGVGFDTFMSIDDVARIEVIRGPVSSLYGANAFFGIINIVTRGAAETPSAWGRVSVNSINGVVTSAGFASGGVHQQVRGTVQVMNRFGDTSDVAGVGTDLKGDGSSQYALSLVGSYQGSFAQVRAYRTRRDVPFAPYNADPTAPTPYSEYDTQLIVEGGHTHELSKRLTVAVRGYINAYEFYDHYPQLGGAPPWDDYGDGRTYGAEVRGRYEIVPQKLGLTAGTEASFYQTESHSYQEMATSTAPDPMVETRIPADFNIEGVYGELDGQPLPWLGFTAGVRYDRNSVIDTRLSPRAALFLSNKDQYGAKLLYAEGFRNPSAYEAFFYDGVAFEQPMNLRSETIRSVEGVLWAKPEPGLSTRFSAFYWDARGVTQQQTDVMTGLLQFQNVGRYVTQGAEAEASYRTASGWYAFGGLEYSKVGCITCGAYSTDPMATTLEYGNVPNAPPWTGSLGVSTPKLWGRAHVSSEVLYIGERATRPDTDAMGNLVQSPSSPAWLDWNWAIYVPNVHGYDFTLGVRNLLGRRDLVVAPGDFDRTDPMTMTTTVVPYVPGEGREIYAKVGYSY
jgi:iron complex outermembrane receptor protein